MPQIDIRITIAESSVIARTDYEVTYRGRPARLSGPPEDCYPAEAPEYIITDMRLFLDDRELSPVPTWLRELIETGADDDILEHINRGED